MGWVFHGEEDPFVTQCSNIRARMVQDVMEWDLHGLAQDRDDYVGTYEDQADFEANWHPDCRDLLEGE